VVACRGINTKEKLHSYLSNFIDRDAKGEGLTLVARLNSTNEAVGISRFHNAGPNFLRVEIGFTWIADRWTRTFVNTEKKKAMLGYAFEKMAVKRVEFSVDPQNEKSNKAMIRIGAKFEGTLRKWRFLNETDQGHRNIYSIIDDEWPRIKIRFEHDLLKNSAQS
jgi:RimJ/RimL family protein N-acetyltransferase